MERTVATRVDPVSTTTSVTMSTGFVYRGVILATRGTNVQKVQQISNEFFLIITDNMKICKYD